MKKLIIIIVFVLMLLLTYLIYEKYITLEKVELLQIDGKAQIDNYYIYGTHFNMSGYLDNITDLNDIKLITLNNNLEKEIEFNYELKEDNKIYFSINDKINNGFYLDGLEEGNNYLLLKLIFEDESFKYYNLENISSYENLTYYTLSTTNNKILINSLNDYNTLSFNVSKNKDENIYDITIDPGHGGIDPGACSKGNCEEEITLDVSLKLKEELEKLGLKVKLTRESDEDIFAYNYNNKIGRAVVANETNSKYLFSIHLNSHVNKNMHGVEILTADNIDYSFAKSLADNIVNYTNTSYSVNKGYKVLDGVYTRTFTSEDIKQHIKEKNDDNKTPYDVNEGTSYYYMIRETGGLLTGAYVDGRNESDGINPYYNSNKGVESYIIELGYIINNEDINNILNNKQNYINAIKDSIYKELIK